MDKPKVVCNACGSTDVEYIHGANLWDKEEGQWTFDVFKCRCGEHTLVTFTGVETLKVFNTD